MVMRYLAAAALVRLADEGARVALVLLAVERTGSASAGALLVAALLVPHVVAAPAVGLLADRARRPERLLAAAAAGFAAALGAAAIVGSTGLAPLVLLAGGTCGPPPTGGLTSLLPGLVTRERVPRAFGLDSLTYNVAGIGGPAVAALIAQAASARGAVLALAAAAATGALLLAGLPGTTRAAAPGRWDAGVRHVARDPVLA